MKSWKEKKKEWNRAVKALGVVLAASALFIGKQTPVLAAEKEEIPARMKQIAATDSLELFFDEKLTDIAVRVKATGELWFSNPQKADEDPVAGGFYRNLMKSQFSLRYYNQSVQAAEMDNYNDAIENGQFTFAYTDNGVSVTYQLGETADKYILPSIISAERYEAYVGQMEKDAAKKVGRNYLRLDPEEMKDDEKKKYVQKYPALENGVIYVLNEGTKDYKKEELTQYFAGVGYTAEDMYRDNEENGFEAAGGKAWFEVTLDYRLENDSLVAELDPEKVQYDTENYALVDIDLLEYFGAAGTDEEGYLFVPDGSGALIYHNNGKTAAPAYQGAVYGEDRTNIVNSEKKSELDQAVAVRMPVFGLKKGDQAFLAVVENGDAAADINAETSGRTDSYNNVYAGFTYLSSGRISLSEVVGSHGFQMYSEPVFSEPFTVRYYFLSGKEAGYPGMAARYRSYLLEQGVLGERLEGDMVPLYVNFVGAIQKWNSVLGVKYRATQKLTTYAQALEALEELAAQGVGSMKVEYSGWSTGGMQNAAPGATKSLGCLNGSGVGLKDFLARTEQMGIPVFHSAQLQYVWRDGAFDGYRKESDAPRYYDKTVVSAYSYYTSNGYRSNEKRNMISPVYVEEMADTFLKKTAGYQLRGVSVDNLSSDLFSDFYDKCYTDRQMAQALNSKAMEQLAQAYGNALMGGNANAYAWRYLSDITEVPFDSNRTQMIDDAVPFYEMVLHGYKSFTGEALNLTDDMTSAVLKSVECGAGIAFEWICEDNSLLKDTDFDSLYSVSFETWKDTAADTWKRVNEVCGPLQGEVITDHEKLSEGVYRTTFGDGTAVIVNYNKDAVQVQGKTVGAQDFIVERAG